MTLYHITSHAHLDGVRLSKPGHWGNVPYRSEAGAEEAARLDAGGPVTIKRERFPALPTFTR